MKRLSLLPLLLIATLSALSQEVVYKEIKDIPYQNSTDAYITERCKADVYYPENLKECPVVVWFHGGGLTGGNKSVPQQLKNAGMVIIAVNYRLMPKVTIDACLDDAAAAVAWAFKEAEKYNGSPEKLFVSGHSAGGYLTAMLGLDKKWLGKQGIDANRIAGLIPFSGQVISHFAYRDMNGIGNLQPTIDAYAPLFHVRKDAPALILITGDREMEMFGRYEENAYLWRMMKLTGNTSTYLYELDGHGHGSMADPAFYILKQWMNKLLGKSSEY